VNRFACVWVDFFVTAAAERCEPALRAAPLAILGFAVGAPSQGLRRSTVGPSMREPIPRVLDANAMARAEGVRSGMTETEARARCPALVGRPWMEEQVVSGRSALLEAASSVSPRVEDWGPGIVHVDATGLARLFGDPAAVGRRLLRRAHGVGFSARVALADSRTAARLVAAHASAAVTVVPPGREREVLADAPLTVLGLGADLVATLARWGVTTLGELAALPRDGLGTRLGPAGLRAHDLALGHDRDPWSPWAPPPFWEEAQGLDWELDSLTALAAVLEAVLERLCARLTAAHLAADTLQVVLELASGGQHALAVPLATPMSEPGPMLTLATLALAARPPVAAVTRIGLSAHPVTTRAGQGGLWQPPAPPQRELGAVLARLAALAGSDNVGSPRVEDSHRPDAHALVPFAPPQGEPDALPRPRAGAGPVAGSAPPPASPRTLSPPAVSGAGLQGGTQNPPTAAGGGGAHPRATLPLPEDAGALGLVLRRVRPPRRVEVETDGERPVRADGRRVVAHAGPWRGSGEWWDTGVWARDEWDAALGDGTLCRLAYDHRTGEWYLDGVYD